MDIRIDDLHGPEIARLLQEHLDEMFLHSPPESVHALDLETGEAKFTGRIDTLEYTASAPAGGFLRRLLR